MGIDGVEAPKAEKVAEGVKAKVAEATEAVKTALADTDGDGQEHNEL